MPTPVHHPSADSEISAGASTKPYILASNGNSQALLFMVLWHEYLHEIDDLIDNHITDAQKFLRCLASANRVYSTDFYRANAPALGMIVQTVTNTYADSVLWEKEDVEWKRQWADVTRHCGLEMIFAVANLTGGYDLMRSISLQLKEYAYICHHNVDGKPM